MVRYKVRIEPSYNANKDTIIVCKIDDQDKIRPIEKNNSPYGYSSKQASPVSIEYITNFISSFIFPQICPCCGKKADTKHTFICNNSTGKEEKWDIPYCIDCKKHAKFTQSILTSIFKSRLSKSKQMMKDSCRESGWAIEYRGSEPITINDVKNAGKYELIDASEATWINNNEGGFKVLGEKNDLEIKDSFRIMHTFIFGDRNYAQLFISQNHGYSTIEEIEDEGQFLKDKTYIEQPEQRLQILQFGESLFEEPHKPPVAIGNQRSWFVVWGGFLLLLLAIFGSLATGNIQYVFLLILISAVWTYIDAKKRLGPKKREQKTDDLHTWSPLSWAILVVWFWIIIFPLYLLKRDEFSYLSDKRKLKAIKVIIDEEDKDDDKNVRKGAAEALDMIQDSKSGTVGRSASECPACGGSNVSLTLTYPCLNCGYEYGIPDYQIDPRVGVQVMCAKCGRIVTVPPEVVCPTCGHFRNDVDPTKLINERNIHP